MHALDIVPRLAAGRGGCWADVPLPLLSCIHLDCDSHVLWCATLSAYLTEVCSGQISCEKAIQAEKDAHLGGGDGARLPRLAAVLRLQQRLPAAQQEACTEAGRRMYSSSVGMAEMLTRVQ